MHGFNVPLAADALRFIDPASKMGALACRYLDALLARERRQATEIILRALDEGATLEDIYIDVFQTTQYEVGALWERDVISVGHEHYCTNATQMNMAMLYPRLFRTELGQGRLVAACVQGEMHELGMRMLADLFTCRGWNSDYLGANTPPDAVIHILEETPADLLAIGVTMHTHLGQAEKLIRGVRSVSTLRNLPILVGGYAIRGTESLWHQLGADGTAEDARAAVALAHDLIDSRRRLARE